jgi:hypothetical protein
MLLVVDAACVTSSGGLELWQGHACVRSAKPLEGAGGAADPAYSLANARAPAGSRVWSQASGALAWIFVLCGCMLLLRRSRCSQQLTPGVGRLDGRCALTLEPIQGTS